MAIDVLVVQHISCEPPGVYESVLLEHGARITRVELDEGDTLPPWRNFEAIVTMGGPMGAYDDADHPWLLDELAMLAEAVAAGVPVLGICLGAQLIAHATGGRAFPGAEPEVGVLPVRVDPAAGAEPLLAGVESPLVVLQWHGDTYDLPPGATALASSARYPQQAFRLRNALGLQFHLEVTAEMAAEWATVPAYAAALESVHGPGALDRLLADFANAADEMQRNARRIGENFCELISSTTSVR